MASRTWKMLGLAGIVGVTAAGVAGVIVTRRRKRSWAEVQPDELRRRLHERLAEAG